MQRAMRKTVTKMMLTALDLRAKHIMQARDANFPEDMESAIEKVSKEYLSLFGSLNSLQFYPPGPFHTCACDAFADPQVMLHSTMTRAPCSINSILHVACND